MSKKVNIPTLKVLMNTCVEALRQLGGSGTVQEIDEKASKILKLTNTQINTPHQKDKGTRTEFQYRMAWARTHSKKKGLIENPEKGKWALKGSEESKKKDSKKNAKLIVKDKKKKNDKRLIRQVRLQNLLSFGPDTPPLEMENLNVLIGPNGCGKSNFIEAISLIRSTPGDLKLALMNAGGKADFIWKGAPKNNASIDIIAISWKRSLRHYISLQKTWDGVLLQDEVIENAEHMSDGAKSLIHYKQDSPKSFIRTHQNGEWTFREVELSSSDSVLGQIKDPNSYPLLYLMSSNYSQVRVYRDWTFGRDTIFRLPQQADMPSDHLEEDFSNLGMYLNRLRRNVPAKKAVISGLQDLYEGIDDFDVKVEGGTVQVFFTEGNFIIPATRLSDGTLRYLCLMAILLDPEPPPLICIEEPELGLHPDILPSLADHLITASERTQLIVTTHSDILVDAMSERPEVVVVCEKHDGKTEMNRLDRDSLKVWLDKYRLGQLWIDGEIGGKRW